MNLGAVTTVTFASGQSSVGGNLVAYRGEGPVTLDATDGTLTASTPGGSGVALTVPNVAPVAGADSVARARNTQMRIQIANLLANDTDANADLISFDGVSLTSANGATLFHDSTQILYSPAPGSNPASDTFDYTITDGALTNTGTVTVTLLPDATGLTFNIVSSGQDADHHPVITFAGIPGYSYTVQRSQDLGSWTDMLTTNAPAAGLFQFIDLNRTDPAYYRAVNH